MGPARVAQRCLRPPVRLCVPVAHRPPTPPYHPLTPIPTAALRAAVQVIADVLAEYGDNIDAAIKHLNELRLSGAVAQQQGAQQPQAGGAGGAKPAAAPAAAAAAAAAAVAPQQPQQQQQPSAAPEPAGPDAGGGAAAEAPPPPAKSAAEWVDIVVQQMSEARSVEDARQRAAAVLQAFEQAVVQHAKQVCGPLAGAGGALIN